MINTLLLQYYVNIPFKTFRYHFAQCGCPLASFDVKSFSLPYSVGMFFPPHPQPDQNRFAFFPFQSVLYLKLIIFNLL